MSNEEFIDHVIQYYEESRFLSCDNMNGQIVRGKSHSISSKSEDLFAHWLAKTIHNEELLFFVDKPISFENPYKEKPKTKTIQPDVLIIKDSEVKSYADIKMDLGWKRDLTEYLNLKNELISRIRGRGCWYKNGNQRFNLNFSDSLIYQVVVLSGENISKDKLNINIQHATQLEFVELYVLSSNQHLNMYKKNQEREKLIIHDDAFERIIKHTFSLID